MKKTLLFLPFLFFLLAAQEATSVAIHSPVPGEVLRGQVNIMGTTSIPNFLSAQLDFSYASAPVETWFPLQTLSQPVFDATLYTWDTTAITDGSYILRLRVFLGDGTMQLVTVPVSVQNDAQPTALPTPSSTPEEPIALVPTPFLLASSPTPTELPRPTPTPMPANPVTLDPNSPCMQVSAAAYSSFWACSYWPVSSSASAASNLHLGYLTLGTTPPHLDPEP